MAKKILSVLVVVIIGIIVILVRVSQANPNTLSSRLNNIKVWETKNIFETNHPPEIKQTSDISVSRLEDATIIIDFFDLEEKEDGFFCFLIDNYGRVIPMSLNKNGYYSGVNSKPGQLSFHSNKPILFEEYKVFVVKPVYDNLGLLSGNKGIGYRICLKNRSKESSFSFYYWTMAVVE